MKIRQDQFDVFEEARLPEFEDSLVEHLKRFSPLHSEVLGEQGVRGMIRAGIDKAEEYGLTRRGPVQFYIELLFILGFEFDTDPQYPWAAATLGDANTPDQIVRADRTYAHVVHYLETAAGPNREYARRALVKAREMPFAAPSLASPTFEEEVLRKMRELHPERYEYLGEPALRALFGRARAEAKKYAVMSDEGLTMLLGLMFALGHGVIHDPKYAFVAATLTNDNIPDSRKRVERLYSKTMTYLDHALQSRK